MIAGERNGGRGGADSTGARCRAKVITHGQHMLPGGQFSKKAAARSGRRLARGGRGTRGGDISEPPTDQGFAGGRRDVGDDRGGAGGGSQFFRSLRMRALLYPTSDTAALAFLEASQGEFCPPRGVLHPLTLHRRTVVAQKSADASTRLLQKGCIYQPQCLRPLRRILNGWEFFATAFFIIYIYQTVGFVVRRIMWAELSIDHSVRCKIKIAMVTSSLRRRFIRANNARLRSLCNGGNEIIVRNQRSSVKEFSV